MILNKLAELAGFGLAPLGSRIEVTAGSVVVVATFPVATREDAVAAEGSLASYSGAEGRDAFEAAMNPVLAAVDASVATAVTVEVEEDPKPSKGGGSCRRGGGRGWSGRSRSPRRSLHLLKKKSLLPRRRASVADVASRRTSKSGAPDARVWRAQDIEGANGAVDAESKSSASSSSEGAASIDYD
mmetsp:Transcript_9901/g.32861  ORF Transcript_9901/g.32861 Transcript_9901/m.32861 type:complete len:185 (-) Transcript_9901:94-648(-)